MTPVHYIENLYDELRAKVIEILPQVEAGGVWVTQHIDRVPFERLVLPCAGIHIETLTRTHEWPAGCMIFNPRVDIYYLAKQEWDSLEIARELEKLRDQMEFMEITNGQVIAVEEVTWGDSLTPNAFFASKNVTSRAGRVTLNILIGTKGNVGIE